MFVLCNLQVSWYHDVCLEPVSYTHLDVYKRQLLLRLSNLLNRNVLYWATARWWQVRFGIVRLKRMRQPELASSFFVYIVCKQCSGVIGKCRAVSYTHLDVYKRQGCEKAKQKSTKWIQNTRMYVTCGGGGDEVFDYKGKITGYKAGEPGVK